MGKKFDKSRNFSYEKEFFKNDYLGVQGVKKCLNEVAFSKRDFHLKGQILAKSGIFALFEGVYKGI